MTDQLHAKHFHECLNTQFMIKAHQQIIEAELVQVNELNSADDSFHASMERFTLLFRIANPMLPILPQSIYSFEHPRMGAFSIFIVPVEKDQTGVFYEAVFNRINQETSASPETSPKPSNSG